MILLRSLLILLALALSPAHVAAEGPPAHAGMHLAVQIGDHLGDCCDNSTHQATCQMPSFAPEGAALAAPATSACRMPVAMAADRRRGRNPEQILRPPIPR